jgi:hypothetical protein
MRSGTVLSTRALNRALLARQMLLRRKRMSALPAVDRLVGLQAQVPRDPYVALWSRLEGFRPTGLAQPMAERRAVRMPLFRATLHLVSAADALVLRPVIGPVLHRTLHTQSPFGRRLAGLDVDELMAVATTLLEERPRTRAELAPLLAERWPDHDGPSLAYAVTYLLPLVQTTPRGIWGRSGPAAFTTIEHWLGRPLASSTEPDAMVLRYLAVFGPALPADVQSWSGLAGARRVLERLRPQLRTFRDERERELFDVPRAPLPDPATPAPVRFLPEYDNVLLGHKDRGRIVAPDVPGWTDIGWGAVLVDGYPAARWRLVTEDGGATLRIERFRSLRAAERTDLTDEAKRLLAFLATDAGTRAVQVSSYA